MTLLSRVVGRLEAADIRFSMIGAVAMAALGVSRSTLDVDLFTVQTSILADDAWADFDAEVDLRRGDGDDPLAGVVRFLQDGHRPVDLVVGRGADWQRRALDRAVRGEFVGVALPFVQARDLVLFKLFAGGPSDAWDIRQLLEAAPDLVPVVDEDIGDLTSDARYLWRKICAGD